MSLEQNTAYGAGVQDQVSSTNCSNYEQFHFSQQLTLSPMYRVLLKLRFGRNWCSKMIFLLYKLESESTHCIAILRSVGNIKILYSLATFCIPALFIQIVPFCLDMIIMLLKIYIHTCILEQEPRVAIVLSGLT
jgi:hypothetical protein